MTLMQCLIGTLQGNNRDVLHKFSVDLPKKHGRGGQSALRFARLRLEKRHNYVRKVAELAVQMFITADKPNVSGLVLAGSADFKSVLFLLGLACSLFLEIARDFLSRSLVLLGLACSLFLGIA